MIRVLVVDDSAFARKVLREALSRQPDIAVVDIARDGFEALEKIGELAPDVVTLDLIMPGLDGVGVLRALPADGAPRVVVVSTSDAESELAVEALQLGAVELVHKPTALATDRLYDVADRLVAAVRAAATARPRLGAAAADASAASTAAASAPDASAPPPLTATRTELIVVGTSTGGPQALTLLVASLPRELPVPMAIVLHIPAGYTAPFAARLAAGSRVDVVEAAEGTPLVPGRVVVARGGTHLRVVRADGQLRARLDDQPATAPHRPSVDVLFESAAAVAGSGVLGVVLTGMGDDGLAGAQAITAAGGRVVTETEHSCVVYGMPRAVYEAGLSWATVPIEGLAALLLRSL